ncbi:MAG: o-succinylbenzoate synthase [Desulfurococcales archaeon]|nr:o-succinylbenzoate synthase [Desulfurococcales archaeon]
MKLSRIILHHLRIPMKEVFKTALGTETVRDTLLVEVWGEGGEVGWGEVVATHSPWYSSETVETAWHVIRDFIAPSLRGKDVEPSTFGDEVSWIRGHRMCKAGVEFALWDLKGRLTSKPIRDLIGGVKDRVEVGLSVGVIGDFARLIKAVSEGLSKGFRRIKLKVKPGWDVDPVRAVRREFGEIPLQVDANGSFTLTGDHVSRLKELDRYGLLMIEQPLHHEDLVKHSKLQKMISTPICLDESIRSALDAEAAYNLGSCRVINIKPGRVGGLAETLRIHDFWAGKGLPVWIGGMLETGVGRAFAVAAASLPSVKYPSDISPSSRFWEVDVVEPPWELRSDGTMEVPRKPGIGVEVLDKVVRRYEVKSLGISLS